MAWKKYRDMSPEEKKASWKKFGDTYKRKQEIAKRMANAPRPQHPKDHEMELNPGGYCRHCSYGRDHS